MSTAELAAAGAPIALWAVPRSRSTAFLRVMLERGDLEVVHEPFSYLSQDGYFDFAGKHITAMPELLETLIDHRRHKRVFFKETSDYQYGSVLDDPRLFHEVINTFMIREPRATVASHYAMNPHVTLEEIGYAYLHTIFEAVREATGETPLVIDGDELVEHPEAVLRAYCEHVGLRHVEEALTWDAGAKEQWRRTERWHAEVATSTGLHATRSEVTLESDHLHAFVAHHQPYYEALRAHSLRAEVR